MLSLAGYFAVLALVALPTSATVLELVAANYTTYLSSLPDDANCVIEFYASWCPHCRHFMPTYDEVGSHFLNVPEPVVQVARIDCATEGETCRSMQVKGYPTVMFGKPPQFTAALLDGLEGSGIHVPEHENSYTALKIIQHIQQYFNLTETAPEVQDIPAEEKGQVGADNRDPGMQQHSGGSPQPDPSLVPPTGPTPGTQNSTPDIGDNGEEDEVVDDGDGGDRADLRDIVSATVQTFHEMCEADADLWEQREAFVAFWALVRAGHPAQPCRWGAAGLFRKLKAWWPEDAGPEWVPPREMLAYDVCGPAEPGSAAGLTPRQYYSCRGSTPATRGYTCGLWMMLHSLSAGVPEQKGPQRFMRGLRAFIENFFRCEDCRAHFLQQLNKPETAALQTRDDAVEWLWRAHNNVNARLAAEEKQAGDGDPKFPKVQFPPEDLCPACYRDDGSWDTAATVKFLVHYYGPHAADVRGASVTAQSQQDLSNSIQGGTGFKLQAPQRPDRGVPGGPGGAAPQRDDSVADGGTAEEPPEQVKGGGPEEVPLEGGGSGGHWWMRLLWLVGIWFVVSLFCRCRCDKRRRRPPHRSALSDVL